MVLHSANTHRDKVATNLAAWVISVQNAPLGFLEPLLPDTVAALSAALAADLLSQTVDHELLLSLTA
jgi:hypothetical protein